MRELILSFYLPALMVTIGQGLLVPILPLFAADFESGYVLIGLVLAGEGLGTLVADVPTGMLQRRFGNKQVMMMGLLVKSLSILLLFVAPTVWTCSAAAIDCWLWPLDVYRFRSRLCDGSS